MARSDLNPNLHPQTRYSDGLLGARSSKVWRALWEIQQVETLSDLAAARSKAERSTRLREVLGEKSSSPVAAAVAAALLLRSGGLDAVSDWTGNLANRFQWLPDSSALWTETLLQWEERIRAGTSSPYWAKFRFRGLEIVDWAGESARDSFSQLLKRGVPRLAPVLAMALAQADLFGETPELQSRRTRSAIDRLRHAGSYAVSGGLFAAFTSEELDFGPLEVLGSTRK